MVKIPVLVRIVSAHEKTIANSCEGADKEKFHTRKSLDKLILNFSKGKDVVKVSGYLGNRMERNKQKSSLVLVIILFSTLCMTSESFNIISHRLFNPRSLNFRNNDKIDNIHQERIRNVNFHFHCFD